MEVDYLLFHEEKQEVEILEDRLAANATFLFRGYGRWQNGYLMGGEGQHESWDASVRHIQRLGLHVIGHNVTLAHCDEYPELVAAILIEMGWLVARLERRGGWESVGEGGQRREWREWRGFGRECVESG
jgi:hypothetical protein